MDPSHITEFASPRYFDKLRSLNDAADNANDPSATEGGAGGASQSSTFTLPIRNPRPPGGRRRRSNDTDRSGDGKRRLLVVDATSKNHRKPSFTSSIATFRFKVSHRGPSLHAEHNECLFEEEPAKHQLVCLGITFVTAQLTQIVDLLLPIASFPSRMNYSFRLLASFQCRLFSISGSPRGPSTRLSR